MKLTGVEKQEKSMVMLSVTVDKETFDKACDKAYHQSVKRINVPGFRKGKAPRKMIEKMYGPEIFYEDAMNACYPDAYEAAVAEAGIEPVGYPHFSDFDVQDGEFVFKAQVAVYPEVTLKDYKGVEAEKAEVSVSDEEVDTEVEHLADRNARIVTVDRPAQNGDTIQFDFDGYVDGKAFDGGKAENYSLKLGSGMFIPGFEEQLVDKKAGDECDVEVTFPEDYHAKELAGKPAVFKCKVHEVKESQKPELDDEFAKDVSEFDTLAELKADIKAKILESKQHQADAAFEENLLTKIIEGLEGEIPEDMFERQLDRIVEDFSYRMQMQGIGLEAYLKMNNMEPSAFRSMFREQAERQVRVRLALDTVAKLENLEVSAEELDAEYNRLAEQYKMEASRVRELIAEKDLKADLLTQKALELVKNSAKAVAPKAAEEAAADAGAEKKAEKKPAKRASKKAESGEEEKPAKKTTKKSPKTE